MMPVFGIYFSAADESFRVEWADVRYGLRNWSWICAFFELMIDLASSRDVSLFILREQRESLNAYLPPLLAYLSGIALTDGSKRGSIRKMPLIWPSFSPLTR